LKKFTFNKIERICHKKEIETLFYHNKSFLSYPLKVLYRYSDIQDDKNIKILISVPKRNIKKAVNRNLLKRRIKEAFRQHKFILSNHLDSTNKKMQIAFVYIGKEIVDYGVIENKIILTLQRLTIDNEKTN